MKPGHVNVNSTNAPPERAGLLGCIPMKMLWWTFNASIGFLSLMGTALAELSIQDNRLTISVQKVPLDVVLHDLSQLGNLRVTVLEKHETKGLVVTADFDYLLIEEGLSRILADWNYGLTKNPESTKIQEIFLVSQRSYSKEPPGFQQDHNDLNKIEYPSDNLGDKNVSPVVFSEGHYTGQEDNDGFIDIALEESETEKESFAEDMLPSDIPFLHGEDILGDKARGKD